MRLWWFQVVRSAGIYGETATAAFTEKAKTSGVCVAQEVLLDDDVSNAALYTNMDASVRKLLEKPSATVIVVLLKSDSIRPFLEAISRNAIAKEAFRIIGSDTWSDNLALVEGMDDVIEDTITVGVETADLSDFDGYLVDNTAEQFLNNPW